MQLLAGADIPQFAAERSAAVLDRGPGSSTRMAVTARPLPATQADRRARGDSGRQMGGAGGFVRAVEGPAQRQDRAPSSRP